MAMHAPYYHRREFTLYLADCLEILEELPEKVDMIFADPPYNLSNGGFTCYGGKRAPVDKGEWDISEGREEDFKFHLQWIEACRKALKPEGTIWISGTYHSIHACGYALQRAGYKILNDITWFKPNAPPNLSCRYFTASHETLLWAIHDPEAKHTFHYTCMKEGEWKEDSLKNPGTQMRSVWSIPAPRPEEKKHGKHPTQKPELLLKRVILASTNEDDLILDPFTGSSTTGIVAHKYKRRFIGIDTEKEYLDLSIRRFEDLGEG